MVTRCSVDSGSHSLSEIHGLINVNRRTDEHVKVEEYSASPESTMSDIYMRNYNLKRTGQ